MDVMTSIEQVAGIFHREDLDFTTRPDGKAYRLAFVNDMVFVTFDTWQDDSVLITVTSPVLSDIDEDSVGAALVLNRLRELNASYRFVKFVFVDGTLIAAADVLGDELRSAPLLNAVYAVAHAANTVGDELEEVTGGSRYMEPELEVDYEEDVD